jgi:hypothetical protein
MHSPTGVPSLSSDYSHSQCGAHLAQLSLAAYLVGILGTALYMVVMGWRALTTSTWAAEVLLLFVMPAVVYQIGFFHYIPELLGRRNHASEARPEGVRWSSLLLAAQWIFGPLAFVFWAISAGASEFLSAESLVVYLATAFWIFAAAVVCAAVRRYVGLPSAKSLELEKKPGIRHPSDWLICHLTPGIAIPVGSGLVLLSLGLYSSLSSWGAGRYGYEVLIGSTPWITSQHLPSSYELGGQMLFWVGRTFYVLGISLAAVTAFLWIRGRARLEYFRRPTPRLEGITTLAVLISLFVISDLFFGFLTLDDKLPPRAVHTINVFRVAYWLAPLALWSLRRFLPGLQNRWKQWQGAIIVLYLPLVLANSAVLALLTMFAAFGYFAFFLGMLLLGWGFLQLEAERPGVRAAELASTS